MTGKTLLCCLRFDNVFYRGYFALSFAGKKWRKHVGKRKRIQITKIKEREKETKHVDRSNRKRRGKQKSKCKRKKEREIKKCRQKATAKKM